MRTASAPAGAPREPASPFPVRGVIEGFYGRPFTWEERTRLARFVGARGMNTYVYAPKNDPLHRERWRDPYDARDLAAFRAFARAAAEAGVGVVYALAPGLTFDAANQAELPRLEGKLLAMLEAGATGVALLFDDIPPDSPASDPALQAEVVARVARRLAAAAPTAGFWFIGNYYAGRAGELERREGAFSRLYSRSAREYFDAYAKRVPEQLPVLWTGPGVFSATLTGDDARDFGRLAGRPVIVWDNFPANDVMPFHLFLGPYRGRDPGLAGVVEGIVVNLMSQPAASEIALATVADFLRDPPGYDAERAFDAAVAAIGGRGATALGRLARHQRGHPVLASAEEATELGRLAAAALDGAAPAPAALAELAAHLGALAGIEEELAQSVGDGQLLREVAPWTAKLAHLARAALAGLDALAGRAPAAGFRALRDAALAAPEHVASTVLPVGLDPFVAGAGAPVDRFAELFAAIERRLGVAA